VTKSSGKVYLWRGTLGGLMGGLLAEIILSIIQAGPRTNWVFFLLAILLTVTLAVIIGALIGVIIWKSPRWAGQEIGPFVGAVVSAGLVGMAAAGLAYIRYNEMQRSIVGMSDVIAAFIWGAMIGAGAGIAAGMLNHVPYPSKRAIR
jgi:RsiW-degrading membrane proteinase PrsW (M82 family)